MVAKISLAPVRFNFATTTPYPDKLGKQMRSPGMPKIYNQVALKISLAPVRFNFLIISIRFLSYSSGEA